MKQFKPRRIRAGICALAVACIAGRSNCSPAADPGADLKAPAVEVISTTPLPGLGMPKDDVPGNVQTVTDADLRRGGVGLPDLMQRSMDSVNINESQGNPYQPDVSFRGFTASPLLGTPPGLSVYQDGVRINEPFGDTVNWDLLPKSAIANMTLIPGSSPLFGLNTLGGAISITTKDGFDYPGFTGEAYGGSWWRRAVDAEYGGHGDNVGYFVTGNYFDERGWRDYQMSQVRQGFGKLTFRDRDTEAHLSFTGANNHLEGVQTLPLSFLQQDRTQAYTFPDQFGNQLQMLNLDGRRFLSTDNVLQGNVYYRNFRSRNFSTNINDDFDPTLPIAPGNTQGLNVEGDVNSEGYGGGVQYSYLGKLAGKDNRVTVGGSVDIARTDFTESDQEANFANDRSNIPVGGYSIATQARTTNHYYGLFITDTFTPIHNVDLTLSGRYNRAEVQIEDLTGTQPALNGKNTFNRFNPAAGITFKPSDVLTTYLSYNEGMRVPTPVELTCADPAAPCALPNDFLADPPLKPVIARTIEGGARGRISPDLRWHASVYQTTLSDDILFISASAGAPNTGFFQNVGTTRRRGMELGFDGKAGRLTYFASYAFIDARFRTEFSEQSAANGTADANGNIVVPSGSQIPGIPRNILKLRGEYLFGDNFTLGADMYAATGQYARGNENNQDPSGKIGGYAVFNLDAHWRFAPRWELFGEIDNLFDRKYETLGVLGTNFFNGPGHTFDANNTTNELFVAPSAPLAVWVGIRYSFGGREQ